MATLALEQSSSTPTRLEMSAWTPKSNKIFNARLFQERFELIKKWYVAWSEDQKWQLAEYILLNLTDKDVVFLHKLISPLFPPPPPPPPPLPPEVKVDFTRILPRFLSLKIFSYLDPRSLCRASQVSWHWHDLCQQNALWRPKCLKNSWFLPPGQPTILSNPNSFWKRHYINCVLSMFWKPPKAASSSPSPINESSAVVSPNKDSVDSKTLPSLDTALQHSVGSYHYYPQTASNSTHHHVENIIQPAWRHSSRFPKDLVNTSLSKKADMVTMVNKSKHKSSLISKSKNKKIPLHSIPRKKTAVLYQGNTCSTDDKLSNEDGEPALAVLTTSPIVPVVLNPVLMEKVRLEDASEPSVALSTINTSNENRESLAKKIGIVQKQAPFPKLKPYFITDTSTASDDVTKRQDSFPFRHFNTHSEKNNQNRSTHKIPNQHDDASTQFVKKSELLDSFTADSNTLNTFTIINQPVVQLTTQHEKNHEDPKSRAISSCSQSQKSDVVCGVREWQNNDFAEDDNSSNSDVF